MSEENGSDYTNDGSYSNSGKETENRTQKANPSVREFHDYSKQSGAGGRSKGGKGRSILRTLTAAVAATVAAVMILPTITGPKVKVGFDYVSVGGTVLEYVLSLSGAETVDGISVVVETPGGVAVNEQRAESDIIAGTVTGLNEGARYNIVVKNGNSTLATRSVVMEDRLVTELFSIVSQCKYAVDGTFRFRVDFIDENGYWSNFRATLTDEYGNMSECDFSDAPTEEHALAVDSAGMRGNRAALEGKLYVYSAVEAEYQFGEGHEIYIAGTWHYADDVRDLATVTVW